MSEIQIDTIFNDLQELFSHNKIELKDLTEFKDRFSSDDVNEYIWALSRNTAPETALATYFFNPKSSFFKELLDNYNLISESSIESGVPDLKAKEKDIGREIRIELKKLYEKKDNKLVKQELKPENHRKQVEKYLEDESPYVILTNLETYYLYSHKDLYQGNQELEPFAKWNLKDLHDKLDMLELYDALERQKSDLSRDELEERFFNDLNKWVKLLRNVKFEDKDEKDESIIYLINKLVFVQTLSDLGLIEYNWMKESWEHWNRRYGNRSPKKVVKNFIEQEIDEFFYGFYDTELFREDILEDVKDTPENYQTLYKRLKQVLGFESFQTDFKGSMNGIVQYQYNEIDEDIFGKAYETFLADLRKEEGIYYTPRYISEYIVKNTVEKKFKKKADQIIKKAEQANSSSVMNLVKDFNDLKVLDPACGSGSFLLKALETIWNTYNYLENELDEVKSEQFRKKEELNNINGKNEVAKACNTAKRGLGLKDEKRTLISKAIIRHIHGKDKDKRAIDVAKVNLWLKAMKQAPKEFKHTKISTTEETNHILPDLENNLVHGDSLIGFEPQEVSKHLKKLEIDINVVRERMEKLKRKAYQGGEPEDEIDEATGKFLNFKKDKIQALTILDEMNRLFKKYRENPTHSLAARSIYILKNIIYPYLGEKFEEYLKENDLDSNIMNETDISHFALDFWHVFLDEDGKVKNGGFDAIIGNPPYVRVQNMNHGIIDYIKKRYKTAYRRLDISIVFFEKATKLTKPNGKISYISSIQFRNSTYGKELREFLGRRKLLEIVDLQDLKIFEGATTYPGIITWNPKRNENKSVNYYKIKKITNKTKKSLTAKGSDHVKNYEIFLEPDQDWKFESKDEKQIKTKLNKYNKLKNVAESRTGIITGMDDVLLFDPEKAKKSEIEDEMFIDVIRGSDPKRWYLPHKSKKVIYPYEEKNDNTELMSLDRIKKEYSNTYRYLKKHEKKLRERQDSRKNLDNENWYKLVRPGSIKAFNKRKIVTPGESKRNKFCIDESQSGFSCARVFGVIPYEISCEKLLGILNSSLVQFYLHSICPIKSGGYYSYSCEYLDQIPIKYPQNTEIENKVKRIIELVKKLDDININFLDYISNYKKGKKLNEIHMPITEISKTVLSDTKKEKDKLRIGSVKIREKSEKLILYASARYKPENKDDFDDLDRWGYTETELIPAMRFNVDGKLKALIKEFVPIAVNEASGFANFRETATKTNSLIDRLEKLTLPELEDVESGLEKFIENKEKAEKLEREIQETDNEIDAIVFDLYDLTEDEVKTVLDSLDTEEEIKNDILGNFRDIRD